LITIAKKAKETQVKTLPKAKTDAFEEANARVVVEAIIQTHAMVGVNEV